MANKYFNKQVSPKDYKTGGRVGKMGGGMMMMDRPMMKKGGKAKGFPDLTGDDKVTFKDILKGRGVIKKKGGMIKKDMHKMPNGKMMKNSDMKKK